jgi:hypothetical protein
MRFSSLERPKNAEALIKSLDQKMQVRIMLGQLPAGFNYDLKAMAASVDEL